MHSTVIIVESMSATSSFLRRPFGGWTTTSTPAISPSSAARAACGVAAEARGRRRSPSSTHVLRRGRQPAASSASSRGRNIAARQPSAAISVAMNNPDSSSLPPLALIAGPTASGKSALALALAEATGGDDRSTPMRARSIATCASLTARPSRRGGGARAAPPVRPCRRRRRLLGGATGRRRRKRGDRRGACGGRLPILVGGTGLYLRTLIDGIAPVPEIDPGDPRRRCARCRSAEAHAALAREDPRGRRAARARATRPASRARWRWSARPGARSPTGRRERVGGIGERGRPRAADPAAAARLAPRALRRALRRDARRRRDRGGRRAARARPRSRARRSMRAIGVREIAALLRRARSAATRRSLARAQAPPANMPSANIPGSAISRPRTGHAIDTAT